MDDARPDMPWELFEGLTEDSRGSLSLDPETIHEQLDRLTREIAHVLAQSKVTHQSAMYWRERCERAEKAVARLQKQLDRQERGAHR